MNPKKLKFISAISLLLPYVAHAQNPTRFNRIITDLIALFNGVIMSILFVFATLIFLWGVIKYVAKGSEEKAQKEARGLMLWGIIGLTVMLAVWGIINIIAGYFGITEGIPAILPEQ